uniref:Uncharacterized protein n=1 Tax=Arundo donax TaxID=35708 RepID=A0A0A9FW69_ARUDO
MQGTSHFINTQPLEPLSNIVHMIFF